jgi:hypothetical protein
MLARATATFFASQRGIVAARAQWTQAQDWRLRSWLRSAPQHDIAVFD